MFDSRRPSRRVLRRNLLALTVALVSAVFAFVLQANEEADVYGSGAITGLLHAVDSVAHDIALSAREPAAYVQVPDGATQVRVPDPRDVITLIAIDDRSIAEMGAYNGGYPRRVYADLIDKLLVAPPRAVVFDIGFFEPTPDDTLLADAFARAASLPVPTRIVLGSVATSSGGRFDRRAADGELAFDGALDPVPLLAAQATTGLANVIPDERGTIRSMPLLMHVEQFERPDLALVAMSAYLRRPTAIDGRPDARTLQIAGRMVPVDQSSRVLINFFGPPGQAFPMLSLADVLHDRVDPDAWRNRLVFVGTAGAAGLADDFWTPVSQEGHKMPGLEIEANVTATLFSTQFLRSLPQPMLLVVLVMIAMLVALLTANLPIAMAEFVNLTLLATTVPVTIWALYARAIELPLSAMLISGILPLLGVTAFRVAVEQRQARGLQRALASVIPASVAQQIARDPDRVRLGGERREITILFTDLQGFTSFSERVDPQLLSRVMTEYLSAMTEVVFRFGGTLDKFIGDAVMALWNAPLDEPEHALRACEAALAMQAALGELNARWRQLGLPTHRMRIGIHSGPASVGNMGTPARFAYTALGDSVNLAARLEPLNDAYATRVCVSQATLDAAGGRTRLLVRFLDLVAVRGKRQPVAVFELLGLASDQAAAKRCAPLLEAYNRAIVLYQSQQFEAALILFQQASKALEEPDPVSELYVARCRQMIATPPDSEWNFVRVMEHK